MTEQLFTIELAGRTVCVVLADDVVKALTIARGLLDNVSINSSQQVSHPQTDSVLAVRMSTTHETKYFELHGRKWGGETHLAAVLIVDQDLAELGQ